MEGTAVKRSHGDFYEWFYKVSKNEKLVSQT